MDVSIQFVEKMTGAGVTARHSFVLSEAKSPEQAQEWANKLIGQYVTMAPEQTKLGKVQEEKTKAKARKASKMPEQVPDGMDETNSDDE